MTPSDQPPTVADVARARIRELRNRRGLSQRELADRLSQFVIPAKPGRRRRTDPRGGPSVDHALVTRVETGKRELSLKDAVYFALALDVAPVNLIAPLDPEARVQLAPNLECSARELRHWLRGLAPMSAQDARTYFTEVPDEELPEGWITETEG
jgi:transcriptional regulator with XRE-family HTH domain